MALLSLSFAPLASPAVARDFYTLDSFKIERPVTSAGRPADVWPKRLEFEDTGSKGPSESAVYQLSKLNGSLTPAIQAKLGIYVITQDRSRLRDAPAALILFKDGTRFIFRDSVLDVHDKYILAAQSIFPDSINFYDLSWIADHGYVVKPGCNPLPQDPKRLTESGSLSTNRDFAFLGTCDITMMDHLVKLYGARLSADLPKRWLESRALAVDLFAGRIPGGNVPRMHEISARNIKPTVFDFDVRLDYSNFYELYGTKYRARTGGAGVGDTYCKSRPDIYCR